MTNARQQFIEQRAKELDTEIYEKGTRNIGHALAHTEHFREVLAYALEERYGRAGSNMIMTLVQAGEDNYMRQ